MKKRILSFVLVLGLILSFWPTDISGHLTANAVEPSMCVCGYPHTNTLGHTSSVPIGFDTVSHKGVLKNLREYYCFYENDYPCDKELDYSSYVSSLDELNLAYDLSYAAAKEKNDPSLLITNFTLACDITIKKPWRAPSFANITINTQGYDIKVDLTDLEGWYVPNYCALSIGQSSTVTITSGTTSLGANNITKISGLTYPKDESKNIASQYSDVPHAGICITSGTLNLYGVEIDMDDTQPCDGVFCDYNATVNIYEGSYLSGSKLQTKITGNSRDGIHNKGGTVNVYGGLITDNGRDGINHELYSWANEQYPNAVNIYGGTISNNNGSGIGVSEIWSKNVSHTIDIYGGTITGNKQGGVKMHNTSTLALHGEDVPTSIALEDNGTNRRDYPDSIMSPIKITGNTGGNVIAHCDKPGSITVTPGTKSALREGSTIGITESSITTYNKTKENVTDGTPESWTFFTSDLSGYVMSFEDGKVIQSTVTQPKLEVQNIVTTYTGEPVDASLACVSASCDGEWVWMTDVPIAYANYSPYWVQFTPKANHYNTVSYQIHVTINPKPITITITPNGGTYGGVITPAAVETEGILPQDTLTKVHLYYYGYSSNGVYYNRSTTPPTDAGNYHIEPRINDTKYTISNLTYPNFVIKKGERSAPVLTGRNETVYGKNDGAIEGLTFGMSVSSDGGLTYNKVLTTNINNPLAPQIYYVKYQSTGNYNESDPTTVVVGQGPKMQVTLPDSDEQKGYTITADHSELAWNEELTLTYSLEEGYNETDDFKITVNGTDVSELFGEDGTYTFVPTENVTVAVTGVADETAPDVTVDVKTVSWKKFINKVTFGLFFKESVDVTVTASDSASGIASAEYLISETAFTSEEAAKADASAWTPLTLKNGSATISMTAKGKKYVYARVRDGAGNITVVSADGGMAVYTDSTANTQSINYIKTTTHDVTAKVNLNGNTVKEIYNGTELIDSAYYTVSADGTIAFKAEYLDTLAENQYTLNIHYKPCGEVYAEYPADGENINDEPLGTSLRLMVVKQTGTVTITNTLDKIYDGTPVSGLQYTRNNNAGEVTVEYKVQGANDSTYTKTAPKNAGHYTVRVTVDADADGFYTEAVSAARDFTIYPKAVTIDDTAVKTSKVYDGTATAEITDVGTLSANYDGENLSIQQGIATYDSKNVGVGKTVSFSGFALVGSAKDNYTLSAQPTAVSADITEKTVQVSVHIQDKAYDGLNTAGFFGTPTLIGLIEGDSVQLNNGIPTFTDVAVATDIPVAFTEFTLSGGDAANYNLQQPTGITASIYNTYTAAASVDYVVNSNDWQNTDFVVTAMEGYSLSLTNIDSGVWCSTLSATEETSDGQLTFYVRCNATKVISLKVTENYKIDKTVPCATAKFSGAETVWNTFSDIPAFDLFFNAEQKLTVGYSDSLSGVEKAEYYESATALSREEVLALADECWSELESDGVTVPKEDGKRFVYYLRLTDKAGNVLCISTDGAEYDLTLPVISNVSNGETYYTTQTVGVSDKNLLSVTVNGVPLSDLSALIVLSGNQEATYTISAVDKAGNNATVTVTMKKIADKVPDITTDNVKSSDKTDVEKSKEGLGQLDTTSATPEEKQEIEKQLTKCDELLDKIKETSNATKAEKGSAASQVNADNVKPENKADLEKSKESIEKALDRYEGNLTDDEKDELKKEVERIDQALEVIERVETVKNLIDSLPDDITDSDSELLKEAVNAYKNLSDYEQSLLKKESSKADIVEDELKSLEKTNSLQTGDNSHMGLWFALLFVSGVTLTGTAAYGKKRKYSAK